MATYLRKNAWNQGGDFSNLDLLWYAKGVGKMMSRALDDQASWWFYAAIHGEYVSPHNAPNPSRFPGWKLIKPAPKVPTSPIPGQDVQDEFWNQCQHGSWYFLPWHRGYLKALEAQLRQDIVSLNGPADWALPYWNYFGGTNGSQFLLPPAFGAKTLPDGTANPLYVAMRYGPDADGDIYIPTSAGAAAHPGDTFSPDDIVTDGHLKDDLFTGTDQITTPPGFGGPESDFSHSGKTHGNLESDPHDMVHVYVGGGKSATDFGLMSNPGTAALDPIFYLHHANIDRMWAVWNASGNANPTSKDWLDGPAQAFVMPGSGGNSWKYTPEQMQDLAKLDYTYEELPPNAAAPHLMLAERMMAFGLPADAAKARSKVVAKARPEDAELLGSNQGAFQIKGPHTTTAVKLDPAVRAKAVATFNVTAEKTLPDNVYLRVENVRGNFDASVLGVYVNLPEGAAPLDRKQYLAGHIALFGLHRASEKDGQHGGEGLSFVLDITPIVDRLHLAKDLDDSLQVSLVPTRKLPDDAEITVGRVSVYRQGFRPN